MLQGRLKWIICIALPLATGGASAWLTRRNTDLFAMLNKPPLSPPGWLFPVVWTGLFILMGVASCLVLTSEKSPDNISQALRLYLTQLIINFFWPIFFFNLSLYLFSLLWLILLWLLVLTTAVWFERISRFAGFLMLSYLLWVTFAGYLNFGIVLLN